MPSLDDLSTLKAKPFLTAVEKLEELMTQSGRAFLLGAGCSKCAGLPLTAELTANVLGSALLDAKSKEILRAIESNFDGATLPNIEDYLSELVDFLAISDRRTSRGATARTTELGKKASVQLRYVKLSNKSNGQLQKPLTRKRFRLKRT